MHMLKAYQIITINTHILLLMLILFGTASVFDSATTHADTVTDQLARQVNLPTYPVRIVALAPSVTEILFALGQGNRLVGVTRFSDYPEAALDLPKVGSYVHLDLERIIALDPDLCIGTKDGNPKAVVERLEALNIPVYVVDPRDLNAVVDTMIELGNVLGASKIAAVLASDLRNRIQHISDRISKRSKQPGIFFQIGLSPIVSVGTDTFIHQLIQRAGGRNLAEGLSPYPRFSIEQVIALAPDIIIITSMAREGLFEEIKAEWRKWREIPAVKHNRIYLVDSNLFDRATPRLVDGLEVLAKLIHPELFAENN